MLSGGCRSDLTKNKTPYNLRAPPAGLWLKKTETSHQQKNRMADVATLAKYDPGQSQIPINFN